MFLFKCTVILAILCGINSHHCLFDCDKDGLVPTRLSENIVHINTYESLIDCSEKSYVKHCSGCTPGTGHKLYDNITELVPLERCYSICFSKVMPPMESGRRGLFKTNVFAEDLCTSNLKEAFVCFSACLFTLRRNNVVREIVRINHYHLPSNATCTDFCIVPGGICDRALGPDVPANCMEDCRTHLCPSSCQNIHNNFNLSTGSDFGGPGSGVDLSLRFTKDVTLRKSGVMEIFATYKKPLPKAYGLIWRVTHMVGDQEQTQYIPQHLPLFLLPREVGPLYRDGSNLFAIRELQCKTGKLEYALVDDQGVGRFTTVQDKQCFYGSWFPRPPKIFPPDISFQQSTGELLVQFITDELSLDSQYVEENRVRVVGGYNHAVSSCYCRKYDLGTSLRDKAFQVENNSLVARIETTQEVISWFPNIFQKECDVECYYYVVVYATTQNATSCSKYPLGDVYTLKVPFPDYQLISFSYYTHTIVWDVVTGKANVSVYVNVTSHWTSLAVLKGFEGALFVEGFQDRYFVTNPFLTPVVPTKKNYVFFYPNVLTYNITPHVKQTAYMGIYYNYSYGYKVLYPQNKHPINLPINSIHCSQAYISHKVAQGEILCSTRDNTTYQGDRYCLFVEDSGGERHEVECDDSPVSGNVKELKKLGYTAICSIGRVHPSSHLGIAYYEMPDAITGYGGTVHLNCDSCNLTINGVCITQGDWYHNNELVPRKENSSTFTIRDADFGNNGIYQCVNNGSNNTFSVAVYGQLGVTTQECDSNVDSVCVKNIPRGQTVSLCTNYTTTPSTGRHFPNFTRAYWRRKNSTGKWEHLFVNDSCHGVKQSSSSVDYSRYSTFDDFCLLIKRIYEREEYSLELLVNPDIDYPSRTATFVVEISTDQNTNKNTIIAVSITIVTIVVMATIVVIAIMIFIKYRRSKFTTPPPESEILLQERRSSRPSNLTVYRRKDVKRSEKIGRGSFCKVYRGKLSDSHCAIKKLRGIKRSRDRGRIPEILKELDTWSSLNHPNIVSLYGIYYDDDSDGIIPSIIVELMDRNLTDQLNSSFDPTHRKSLFPLKTKLSILSQVAGALDYLHCIKGVLHGDLTANNILLKENSPGSFTSKLADFGMSRVLNEQDNIMSTAQGTYSYMPPEVQNAGETTTKVDIYSFGVLCVHVLSHRFPKPLHALTMDGLGACIAVSEFNRYRPYLIKLEDDEKLLEPLIEECLQYAPEDRLCPEELKGQLTSIEGRLRLKETGPANPNQPQSVINQQFSGPIVSGCTISGSVMNVGSFLDSNMQLMPVADIAQLPAPLEVITEVSFNDNLDNSTNSLTAPSEGELEVLLDNV